MKLFSKSKDINFTKGSIIQSVVMFAVPLVLGELLQNLYNSADALVVGNFVGEEALTAVTVCGIISNMIINFFNGMSVGSNAVVSRAFGEGDEAKLKRTIQILFTFSTIFGLVFSVLGIVFSPQLLIVAGADGTDYYADALSYLRIYLAGVMFTVMYNNGAGILRAVGASTEAFIILSIACVSNIALDLFFTAVLPWGVVGVGVATVLAQSFSTLCVYRSICRRLGEHALNFSVLIPGRRVISDALSIGVAAGINSAMIGISNLFIVRYMNLFDTLTVAGIGISQKLDRFIITPAKSFGLTMTTFVSQNIGAQKEERIQDGKRKTLLLGIVITVLLSSTGYVFAPQITGLFSDDPKVITVATDMCRVFCPWFFIVSTREIYVGYLRAFGKSVSTTVLTLTGMVVLRQIYLYFAMTYDMRVEHIYYCYPIAWGATCILVMVYYMFVRKKCEAEAFHHEAE